MPGWVKVAPMGWKVIEAEQSDQKTTEPVLYEVNLLSFCFQNYF